MEISVFFRNLIGACSFREVKFTLSAVKIIGRKFQTASPHELIIGNIARRVLKIIRDCVDMKSGNTSDTGQDSLSSLLSKGDGSSHRIDDVNFKHIKADVIQAINEDLVHNLEDLHEDIAKDALDYIHPGEVILTYGSSETIKSFLCAAKKRDPKRHFDVLVAESSRVSAGHKMASSLARNGVNTTLIANSAIFAMMARVDKVIVGANAVMANGGLIGTAGLHALALAAKHHSVPLVCVTGLYKLCPEYPSDQNSVNNLLSPSQVLSFEEMGDISRAGSQKGGTIEVLNPAYDYVPPGYVNLFITNSQASQPSYMYRLLQELYHRDDYVLV